MAGKRGHKEGELRIIAGLWRGRKLRFKATPGLRPTPDRVRETLFNWLAGEISAAHCLDLFAGSGALGLEALSRGADHCVFVDTQANAIQTINGHLQTLSCNSAETHCADALHWLQHSPVVPAQLVFLDPPFAAGLLPAVCAALEARAWLVDGATIYLESGSHETGPTVPPGWQLKREKISGEVRYQLFVRPR